MLQQVNSNILDRDDFENTCHSFSLDFLDRHIDLPWFDLLQSRRIVRSRHSTFDLTTQLPHVPSEPLPSNNHAHVKQSRSRQTITLTSNNHAHTHTHNSRCFVHGTLSWHGLFWWLRRGLGWEYHVFHELCGYVYSCWCYVLLLRDSRLHSQTSGTAGYVITSRELMRDDGGSKEKLPSLVVVA